MTMLSIITLIGWTHLDSNGACDTRSMNGVQSEIDMGGSSKKVTDLAACKKSCENDVTIYPALGSRCNSITFFADKWCSHFSTPCMVRKFTKGAISMRWDGNSITSIPLT